MNLTTVNDVDRGSRVPTLLAIASCLFPLAGCGDDGGSGASALTPSVRFVAANGSDSNAGTRERPWRTLRGALARVGPGTVVNVRSGTYREAVVANRSGTRSAPITLRGYGRARPVITGQVTIRASHFRLSRFVVEGRTRVNPDGVAIYVAGGDHVSISRTEVRDAAMSGIYLGDTGDGADHVRIVRNHIHDNGTHWNLDHGVYFGHGKHGVIANNVVERNLAHGIKLAPEASAVLTTHNTVVFNERSGIIVGGDTDQVASRNIVVNNIVAYNDDFGIRTFWEADVGTGNVAEHNLGYANRSADFGGVFAEGLIFRMNRSAPPLFASVARGNYRLRSGSPALDWGFARYSIGRDYDGRTRPRGSGPDIGAFER